MRQVAEVLLALFAVTAVVLVLGLVVVRAARELLRRRREARQDEVRRLVLSALLGEGEEAGRAAADLRARRGRAWDVVEDQAFAMIPKIKGDTRTALVELLESRGAAGRAAAAIRSSSSVRRARGAYHLGSLGRAESAPLLIPLLGDRDFLVRRSAVRALGQVDDPRTATALLDAAATDPVLSRDVTAALDRLGPGAAPALRAAVGSSLDDVLTGGLDVRRTTLAARALGLVGDVACVPLLIRALARVDEPSLQVAAAEALGALGAPEAVPPLTVALHSEADGLRSAAARALGAVSDPVAVCGLVDALPDSGHEASRAVAGALLRLGDPGLHALEDSGSPYAVEALAVHRMELSAG